MPGGIAAEIRLGQAEAADELAARHRGQPRALLRFVAPAIDRVHRERALNRREAAHAGIAGLELQARDAVRNRARAGAAVAVADACPSSPSRPSSRPSSRGSIPASNHSATLGSTRSRTYARTVSRTSRSSSESSRETSMKSTASGAFGLAVATRLAL